MTTTRRGERRRHPAARGASRASCLLSPPLLRLLASTALLAPLSCSSASDTNASGFAGPGDDNGGRGGFGDDATGSDDGDGTGSADGGAGAPLRPEGKIESNYRAPVATGKVVWTANPTSGRVAYIDATTLDVHTAEAGNQPTYLAAVPDPMDDVAVVLNVLSSDATVLRDHRNVVTASTFSTAAGLNALAVDATGRWVLAWTDATQVPGADPTRGFQDVTLLDLGHGANGSLGANGTSSAIPLTVGYRPVKVAFAKDGSRAFLVTQDGVSVIDLTLPVPAVTHTFPVVGTTPVIVDASVGGALDAGLDSSVEGGADAGSDAASDAAGDAPPDTTNPTFHGDAATSSKASSSDEDTSALDVSITPDGAYALVRQDGVRGVGVIALATGTRTFVPLTSAPTDLALSPSGAFAVAALRNEGKLVVLPLPAVAATPSAVQVIPVAGETVGRAIVTQDGKAALVFTTAAAVEHVTVVQLGASPSARTIRLYSPIAAVFPASDGRSAIVLHDLGAGARESTVRGAFSVVPLGGDEPAKIVSLPASPNAVAIDPSGGHALVTTRDDTSRTYGAYLVDLRSMVVATYPLSTPPTAAGIAAAASRGYVAQEYADGRLTFLDFDGSRARTITGFEIGARIVDGSGR